MACVVEQFYRISIKKASWQVRAHELIEGDNGVSFVKINSAYGFQRLVLDDCQHVDKPTPKGFSMVQSNGLRTLMQARNDAQSQSLTSRGASMFVSDGRSPPKAKARVRRSLAVIKLEREKAEAIGIAIPAYGDIAERMLEVLRPLHPSDGLSIKLKAEDIEAVVMYLRWAGFTESNKQKFRDPAVPKGVWCLNKGQRNKRFIVPKRLADGKRKYNIFGSVQEAATFADDEEVDGGCSEASVGCELEAGGDSVAADLQVAGGDSDVDEPTGVDID
jgi:hypothetical protein